MTSVLLSALVHCKDTMHPWCGAFTLSSQSFARYHSARKTDNILCQTKGSVGDSFGKANTVLQPEPIVFNTEEGATLLWTSRRRYSTLYPFSGGLFSSFYPTMTCLVILSQTDFINRWAVLMFVKLLYRNTLGRISPGSKPLNREEFMRQVFTVQNHPGMLFKPSVSAEWTPISNEAQEHSCSVT